MVPSSDNSHAETFNFFSLHVHLLLHSSPLTIDDIPSSPIAFDLMSSSCREQLTFNNSPRQSAPVMTAKCSHYYTKLEITASH